MSTVTAGEIAVNVIVRTGEMEKGLSKATSAMNIFKRSASIAAGIMARDLFYAISDTTREAITLGASMETLERSFNALAGVGDESTVSIEALEEATMGMISRVDLLTQANRALALGLPTEDLDELFVGAIKLGKAMGLDATTAVEKLTLGLGRQSYRLLDDLGIIIRASDANEIYAKRIGKTVDELTASERQTAFHTVAIERLNEKVATLGDNIGDTDKSLSQWDATIRNVTVSIGELITPLGTLAPIFSTLSPVITGVTMAAFSDLGAAIGVTRFAVKGLIFDLTLLGDVFGVSALVMGGVAGLLIATLPYAIRGYIKLIKDLTANKRFDTQTTEELIEAEQAFADAMMEATQAASGYTRALEQYNSATEKTPDLLDAWVDAENKLAKAQEKEADALERLNEAKENQRKVDAEYTRVAGNLVNLIKYVTGEARSYDEVLKDTTYHVEGTAEALTELEKNLSMTQTAYSRATARVNKLTQAMEKNNRTLSKQSIEQMKIRDAIQDREDAAQAQIAGVDNEISKLEKLAQTQGFLTFTQRKQLEAYREQRRELEDAGQATQEEDARLRELADKERELEIRNAELALKLEKATDKQDEKNRKMSEAQALVDQLTSLNENLNNIYVSQRDAEDDVNDAQENYNEAKREANTLTTEAEVAETKYRNAVEAIEDAYIRAAEKLGLYNDKIKERITLQKKLDELKKTEKEKTETREEAWTPPQWTPPQWVEPLSEDPWMNQAKPDTRGWKNTTPIQPTNSAMERGFTNNVNVTIENIYSDNADFLAENLKLELERRGLK